jgi:sulfoxide reductase catalytic subunit YedY
MLIKKRTGYEIPSSEITPEHIYLTRRQFMAGAAALAGVAALAACRPAPPGSTQQGTGATAENVPAGGEVSATTGVSATTDELGDPLTDFQAISNYNNFYEFSTSKEAVALLAKNFVTTPWQVTVGGMVRNPGVYDLDDLRQQFDQEERIYRLRCVEAWSMVIPWLGFPLRKLLEQVEPANEAKYVRFETLYDPSQMPGQTSPWFEWPYVEGLRLDEAMNDLAILSTGRFIAAKRCADTVGRPLEVWLQEHQVHRQD